MFRVRWLRAVACVLALIAGPTAWAQSSASGGAEQASLRAQADLLFKQILVDPKNLDLTFRYAEIESTLGDYEAAIGALERMLFYSKDLPRVELELGLLYFRLGSYEMANSHFEKAVSAPATPDEVRRRVETFQHEIANRLNPNQYSVYAQTGLRYQSNANAGPDSALVRALGFDATLSSQFQRSADWNAFALVTARYAYDFENQRGDTWESGITAYYSRQFSLSRLNLGLVEVATGPRLTLGGPWLSVRPYALANVITLGDNDYLNTAGAGVTLRWQGVWGQIEPGVEYRARSYRNSPPYPNATDQNGGQIIGSITAGGATFVIANLKWQTRLSATRANAVNPAYAYNQFGIEFALPFEFDGPFGEPGRHWTFAPSVGYFDTRYDAINPLVDPTMVRHDQELRVGAVLDMSIYRNVGLAIQTQYSRMSSNLPNYRTTNLAISVGPTVRF